MKKKMLGLGILAITMSFCHISGMRSAKIKNESKKPWYFQFVNSGGGSPYSVETYFRADSGRLKLKPGEVSALVRINDRDKETKLYITDDDMYMKNWDDMKRGLAYAFTPGKTRVNIIISDNEGTVIPQKGLNYIKQEDIRRIKWPFYTPEQRAAAAVTGAFRKAMPFKMEKK